MKRCCAYIFLIGVSVLLVLAICQLHPGPPRFAVGHTHRAHSTGVTYDIVDRWLTWDGSMRLRWEYEIRSRVFGETAWVLQNHLPP